MRLNEYYEKQELTISFEIFPPKTEDGLRQLEARLSRLIELNPSFISVTYGAMGSTRSRTLEIASKIRREYGMETAHHLTCVGANRHEIQKVLEEIRAAGIENIVALRGDPPKGETKFQAPKDGYSYAVELVEHIRNFGGFGIAVAGYPEKHIEASDFETDLYYLKDKADAGADVIITQLFYDNSYFYRFVERCRAIGIRQPIVPGLLPILNVQQIRRITSMCGSSIPDSLQNELQAVENDEPKVMQVGIRHITRQVQDLLEQGVPGVHFYVLNRFFHIAEIMAELGFTVRKPQPAEAHPEL